MQQADHISSALNLLRLVREETDSIGVAVSYGKDSLATLDLCCQIFRRVEGYYLFRVRGLDIVQGWADEVRRRHGVFVRNYPHFDLVRCYRAAVLQPNFKGANEVKKIKMTDIERVFRREAAVEWIAYGWRRNDSISRAMIMKKCGGYDPASRRIFPLRAWSRAKVLGYLAARGIPIPPGLGRKDQGGLDFHPAALSELREKHPADWAKWERDFPLSDIQCLSQGVPAASGVTSPIRDIGSRDESSAPPEVKIQMVSRDFGRDEAAGISANDRLLEEAAGGPEV